MASTDPPTPDVLLTLRRCIATNQMPTATLSADALTASATTDDLSRARFLQFPAPASHSYPLDQPTRFISAAGSGKPVNLRSIWFAWLKKDVAIPEYIASAQRLNEALAAADGVGGSVQNLVFVERLDLITWLEGASDESEYIAALASEALAAHEAAELAAGGKTGGAATLGGGSGGGGGAVINPQLQEIYNRERRLGDRHGVLRGVKPTDFSHVRKLAESYLGRSSNVRPGQPGVSSNGNSNSTSLTSTAALVSLPKKTQRRPDPIILVSPSASSLLRMSNIKSFLESGAYTPADSSTASSTNILHISRLLPGIDAARSLRFILVDTPEQFKPDYWARVVAVFTTGQAWQFKAYKWPAPADLFRHALGIYVGWRGEEPPAVVKGWGRGVLALAIDKWHAQKGSEGRWRDAEVVESVWGHVEASMKEKGWGKDGSLPIR